MYLIRCSWKFKSTEVHVNCQRGVLSYKKKGSELKTPLNQDSLQQL